MSGYINVSVAATAYNPIIPPIPHQPTLAEENMVAGFRCMFPEFQDSSVFLDEMIEPWLVLAGRLLNACRWGSAYRLGLYLFTAHQITLQRQATIAAQRGGIPGLSTGIVQSKSINGVSVSYNASMGFLKEGGDWNLTVYGIRFLSFARMFGSGGDIAIGSDASMVSEAQLIQGVVPFPQF